MKLFSSLVLLFLSFTFAFGQKSQTNDYQSKLSSQSVFYQENKGQIVDTKGESRPEVLFTSFSNGVRTYYKRDGISYVFEKHNSSSKPKSSELTSGVKMLEVKDAAPEKHTIEMHRIDLNFIGSNQYCGIKTDEALDAKDNYYLAHARVTDVKSYKKVTLTDLYDKIDLVLYIDSESNLKYDFVVHPGGDASRIKMQIDGTDDFGLSPEGLFFLGSALGKITESAPVSFQQDKRAIVSSFQLEKDVLSFKVDTYDKTQDLIIDPTRTWGTYFTADNYSEWSYGQDVKSDANGVYFAINTNANAYPVSAGVYDQTYNGGFDIVLAKFSLSGALLWNTYIGSSSDDRDPALAVNGGKIILAGATVGSDFPTTVGTHDQSFNGGYDFFLSRLNTSNGTLDWSTFVGGSSDEFLGISVDVNTAGEIALVGNTVSSDMPLLTPYDGSFNGNWDLYVAKLNSTGNLIWATYFGGSSTDVTGRHNVAFDNAGRVVILGQTYSNDVPTTAGVFQPTYSGYADLFLTSFATNGASLSYSTYIGSTSADGIDCSPCSGGDQNWFSMAMFSDNSVAIGAVTWNTASSAWAATPGTYSNAYFGDYDSYLIKMSSSGTRLWGTTWGGISYDWILDVEVDQSNNVYVLTGTYSSNLPVVGGPHAHQATYIGDWDKHIAKFNPTGSTLLYGAYLGSSDYDMPELGSISFSGGGLYVASNSNYGGFNPLWNTSTGAYQTSATGGGFYPILNKIQFCDIATSGTVTNVTCGNTDGAVDLTATTTTESPLSYSWSNGPTIQDISALAPGTYTVTVTGGVSGCTTNQSFTVGLNDAIAPVANCQPYTATLDGTGNVTITAANVNNGSTDNCGIASMSVSPSTFDCGDIGANSVILTVTDFNGNTATCTATVTVTETTPPVINCPANITTNNAPGTCGAVVNYTAPAATDNCGSGNPTLENVLSGFNTNYNTVFSNIPSPVVFAMDNGVNSNTIGDGYSDMYDGGNYLNTNLASNINYSDNTIINSASFGTGGRYFTRYIANGGQGSLNPCMFIMAADVNNLNNFGTTGNIGADGGGSIDGNSFNLTIGGTTYYCFVKRIYNAFDPSVNQLMIVPSTPSATQSFPNNTDDNNHFINSINAATRIYYLLYSGASGGYINNTQTQAIATAFLNAIGTGSGATVTQTAGLPSGSTFPGGVTTNTFQATDAAGNTSTCSFTVTVNDTQAPTIACPANISTVGTSAAGATVTYSLPTVTDNCPGTTLTQTAGLPSGSTFPLGTTTNTYQVTDVSGNTNTCSFTVTVTGVPPSIVCPADIAVNSDAGSCDAVVSFAATETTGVPVSTITYSHAPGSAFPVGTTTVTATATNGVGTSTCTFDIVVTDNEAPTAVCQNITATLDASGNVTIIPAMVDNGSSDNCGAVTLELDQTTFDCSNVGPNTVTLTVTQSPSGGVYVTNPPSGLIGHWTFEPGQEFTDLTGNWNPLSINGSASVSGGQLDVDAFGSGYARADGYAGAPISDKTLISYVSLDDYNQWAGSALTIDALSYDQFDGLIYAENWPTKWQNGSSGGSRNQEFIPGYPETTNNELVQIAITYDVTGTNVDITGYRNGVLMGSYTSGNAATWFAGDVEMLMGVRHFNGGPVGAMDAKIEEALLFDRALTPAEITALQPLSSTCTATVTVQDITAPDVLCQPYTATLDATGNTSITPTDVLGSTSLYTIDQSGTFAPLPVGGTQLFLSDDVTTGSLPVGFNFTFFGNTYTDFTLSSNGFISFDPAVSQGCCSGGIIPTADGVENVISWNWNDLYPPGGGTIFYETVGTAPNRKLVVSYTDQSHCCGGGGGNTGQIVLNETTNIIEMHTTSITDDGSQHTMGIENFDGSQGYAVPGRNQMNWTAFNDYVAFIPGGSATDACGIATVTVSPNTFTCANVGPNPVVVTATDVNGNVSTCSTIVTVQDVTPPTANCQNVALYLDGAGTVSTTAAAVDNLSTDVCGIASLAISQSVFDCSNVGANSVTLTVTDNSSNTATCTATITVFDTIAPTITCPSDITVSNDAGVCGAVVNYTTPPAVDNCSGTATELMINGSFESGFANWTAIDNPGPFSPWVVNASNNPWFAFGPITPTDGAAMASNGFDGGMGTAVLYQDVTITGTGATLSWSDQLDYNLTDYCSGCMNRTYEVQIRNTSDVVLATAYSETAFAGMTVNGNWQSHTYDLSAFAGQTIRLAFFQNIPENSTGPAQYGLDNVSIMTPGYSSTITQIAGLASGATYPIGTTTNTFVAEDASGNTDTCSFVVTVNDTEAPNALCQNLTIALDATGNASITPAMVDNGSTDNCGIAGITLDNMAFTCANVGPNTVTLTVTDVNGNVSTCTSTVTVQDNIVPNAICQNITVALDASGNATITPAMVDNGSNDVCGIASLALDNTAFTCANVGSNTVTLTVTDNNGNTSTCTATVTVQDNVAPNAICQNLTVNLDATGNATITPAMVDNGSNDACGIASLVLDNTAFTCANVGANTVTLTVTDVNGNTSTCTSTITVQDNVPPVAICQNITANLDATGNVSITPAMVDNGSNDACGIASIALDQTAFDCSEVGANTVALTVTDVNGNVSTCTATVTVQDIIAPNAICQNINAYLDATGNVTITPAQVDNGSNDNCAIATMTLDKSAFVCAELGANPVVLTVTDVNGNVSTCNATVTVLDTITPTFTSTQANITVNNVTGVCGKVVTYPTPTFADNCTSTMAQTDGTGLTSGDLFPVGTTTQTYTVTDAGGNTEVLTFTITVLDIENPVISNCPANITASSSSSACGNNVNWTMPTVSDNCPGAVMISSHTPGAFFPVGTTTVTYNATDASGNTATCTFTVTVNDNVAPVVPVLATVTGECSATVTAPTTTDNCSGTITGTTTDPLTYSTQGTFTVTWSFTDGNGNTSTATQTVIVDDVTAPVVPVLATVTGECSATVTAPTTTDNCSGTITGTTSNPTTYSAQGTYTVTWTFNDGNGNTSTATQMVVVNDVTAPTAVCQPFTVNLDATGNATITAANVNNGSTDNCGIASMTVSPSAFDCSNVGANTVTLTVTDINGNVSTCTSTVTVQDVTPLTWATTPTNITVTATPSLCGRTVNYTLPTYSDNCPVTMTQTDGSGYTSGDVFPVGTTTQTYTATNSAGQTITHTFTVTVQDLQAPVIANCPSNITVNTAAATCGTNVTWSAPIASDNCSGVLMSSSHAPGSFFPVGTTTVTYTATDASGNTATCTFTVTVNDNVAPVAPVLATVTGECSATVTAPTAMDACSGPIVGTTVNPTTYTTQGTYTVTWSFVDGAGNTSTATQTVIVDDVTAPMVPVLATVTGECSATVTAPTTTDNCAGTITGTTSNPTTYSAQGTYTVTWTFNDGNGNTSTATQTVVVNDVTPPTAVCQNFTVNLSASGNASITVANINNGSSDNCGIASMTVSPNTFDCSNVGANTVTLTVTDINGNVSTCTSTVTVADVTPLVFVTTPSNMTVNAIPGFCGRTVNYTLPTYSDNCPATMTQTDGTGYTSGDVFPVGTTTQTYTVTNGAGQTITHTFTITVVDTQFPVIASCPANITVNTSAATCGTNVNWSAPTASDNCPGVLLTTTNAPGSFFPVGTTTVTYSATDNSGNVSTCTFNVTVIDNVAPVVPVLATVTGECSASVTAPTAMDACSGSIVGTTSNPTTYSVQGTYTVTWSFVDGAGNTSTTTQTVIVDDVTAPVVPVLATVTGECSASVTVPTTTDNCSGTITGTTTDPMTYTTQGTHTVTWSFNDGNGNISTATQTVVIDDITAPVVPVLADVTGECTATATAPTTTDNCGGTVTGTTTDALTYTTQGTHVITWTFDDGNGNTSSTTQNVVIDDVTAPTITAAADTIVDANYFGCSALDLALTSPVTNDNCSVVSVTNDAPNPLPFGNTTVTWTVTDINGNTTTDQQVVTVTSNITATVDTVTCDSYTAPDGTVYTSTGTYTATILSYLGCDSVITVNLTILNSTTSSITIDACDTYTAPDGTVYNNSGVYTAIIPNAAGCDSIITVNLTIHTLNLNVATQQDGTELVAIETGVTYQWFNCSNDSIVVGATSQTFVPVLTADYSVILSDGVCIDTTDCYNISLDVVIPEVISPNGDGMNDVFEIIGIEDYPQNHITIYNRWGQVVFEAQGYANEWNGTNQSPGAIATDELPVGTYFYVLDLGPSDDIYVGHVYKGYVYLTR